MPRYHKRAALMLIDFTLMSVALWAIFSFRFGKLYLPPSQMTLALMAAAPLICIATLWWFEVYRVVTRFMGYRGVTQISMAVGLATLIWALVVFMSGQAGIPRTAIGLFGVTAAVLLVLVRYAIKFLLDMANIALPRPRPQGPVKRAVIYGAGLMGTRLLGEVRRARDREVIGFVDTSPSLWRQYVGGVKIHAPERLARLIERDGVSEVLVALPGSQKQERRKILEELKQLPVVVKVLPAYEDIALGHVGVSNLRDVEVGDLLGREPVKPSEALMARAIRGKSVLITGAGGSIGSELVRQMLDLAARRIVLFDISESALYRIDSEFRELLDKRPASVPRPEVKAMLGSVLDRQRVRDILIENEIETIYHAAAYKHVPIVQNNQVIGLNNNAFGTRAIAQVAESCGVERFVLISTDKAVRPANIMGASKRIAELALQAMATDRKSPTIFTVVRFGNVLDSSGSVVPRFREQIRNGGPVTVTHPEVTRYFMSMSEAAELVIQAGAMATGGEVFVLQMGDPIRIDDLARLMIRLSNSEVRDDANPEGDIAIKYIGLRPGEKLYEELLIGAHTEATEHPRIFKSDEPYLLAEEFEREVAALGQAMASGDAARIDEVLLRTVEGYQPQSALVPQSERAAGPAGPGEWPEPEPRTLH